MFDARHELCFFKFVSDMNASSKSKSVKKAKKKEDWKLTGKRITATNKVPFREPITLEVIAQRFVVTKVYTRKPKYLDSRCSKHITEDRSQVTNFVHKFLGAIKFDNDQIAKIMGYGDYHIGNITILRVYYVEFLGHNLFSVGQFCDSDLEVAFRKHTCFVCNLDGDDLISGSGETNLYTLSMGDMMAQNGVVERRNRTLVEAARTTLIYAKALLFLWAEAVATACYTQNCFIIRHHRGKTPYEILHDRKPDLSYLYVFGALFYLNNDSEDLGKDDIGIFIGYAPKKKAYRIYNRRTRKIIETIHANFDELKAMASELLSSGPRLHSMTPTTSILVAVAPQTVDLADSLVSTSIDQDAPSTSIPSSQEQEHSLIISQGFDESPKMPHFHNDPFHESLHEDSTSQGLSSNVRPIHTLFESLGLWYSKDAGMSLIAYADADHAGCQDTRRGTLGSAQFLGDKLATVTKHKASYRFTIDNKNFSVNVEVFEDILNICPRIMGKEFDEPPSEEEALSFIRELAISSEKSPSKKKFAKAKKVVVAKPKPTKKKAPVKASRGKGLNVLSVVALSEAGQLKEATKRSKKDFHISQASGSGDGTDFQSGVPDEQHRKTSSTDEGTGTKRGVLDIPKYDYESKKESWDDSEEEDDDDENDAGDENDDDGNYDGNDGDGNDDDDDANDDDNQKDDDTYDDDEETDKEKIYDEETMDEEEDDEVTKELYKDVKVNLGNRDADMTDADQGDRDQ
nr:retrovirus-related Pol polyprotein from transposon TNT 1-94 [Tanacetum cinerariifolium]